MSLTLRIALSLAVLAPVAVAQAADYDPPVFVEEAAEYVPVEVGSGWYLRGDVGYAIESRLGQVDYRTYDGASYDSASFDSHDIESDFTWGGGFGYAFTDYFRADATVDGFRSSFDGTTSSAASCFPADGAFDNTSCRSEDRSEFSAISVMANGYVDLGTYIGITPYVGAGAGYSYVSWSDLDDSIYCVNGTTVCPVSGSLGGSQHGGEDGWRFTYALMAGFAYDLSQNFKLDFGYKYRHIEGGDMFAWNSGASSLGASGNQGSHGDIEQHEIKVGLRYELW